ncbi:MAG: DNA-directed RNA polymerase specialized sigma24 family protein [Flavobacteriaceae bacterium]|jgi:DNA-directed RNA polymerase specialized sigma24 family protein
MRKGESSQEQFMILYEPVHNRFERFCRARAGRVEYKDLMHDTLLIAFEKFDHPRSFLSFLSFLFGISIRVMANLNRKASSSRNEARGK